MVTTYVIARSERYLEVEYGGQPAEWAENIKDDIHYDEHGLLYAKGIARMCGARIIRHSMSNRSVLYKLPTTSSQQCIGHLDVVLPFIWKRVSNSSNSISAL